LSSRPSRVGTVPSAPLPTLHRSPDMAATAFTVAGARRGAPGAWVTAAIFLPPAVALFTVFVILPIGEAAWYSSFNWNGLGLPTNFVGLGNYAQLFANKVFTRALV